MTRLDSEQIERELAGSPWQRDGETIVREYKLEDFGAALTFVNRVGELAEQANHHPDILVHGWNRVRLVLWSHSEGGVTEADLAMSRRIDALG